MGADRKKVARIFKTGGSQAVRLPREFRFDENAEVWIHREGGRLILETKRREWSEDFVALAGSVRDFPYPDEPGPVDAAPDDLD